MKKINKTLYLGAIENYFLIQSRSHTQSPFFLGGHYAKKGVAEKNRINYSTGGMPQPGRGYQQTASKPYRFGFNGKENDNEVKGKGNQQDYGMRIYDTRLVRFLSTDPLYKSYPELTPYQYASNSPIENIDLDGLEKYSIHFIVRNGKDIILKTETDNSTKYKATPTICTVPTFKPKVVQFFREDGKGNVISKTADIPLKNIGGTLYVGQWNPDPNKKGNEFYLPAINSLDAAGLKHDKAYAKAKVAGISAAFGSLKVINADKELVNDALNVVKLYASGKDDPISKGKVSSETATAALYVAEFFSGIVAEKSARIGLKEAGNDFKASIDSQISTLKQSINAVDNWTPMPAH